MLSQYQTQYSHAEDRTNFKSRTEAASLVGTTVPGSRLLSVFKQTPHCLVGAPARTMAVLLLAALDGCAASELAPNLRITDEKTDCQHAVD